LKNLDQLSENNVRFPRSVFKMDKFQCPFIL